MNPQMNVKNVHGEWIMLYNGVHVSSAIAPDNTKIVPKIAAKNAATVLIVFIMYRF